MATLDEKRKVINNDNSDIVYAKVIANYGDPGLDEDYQFDILSRYLIVAIESCDRVLTGDKWPKMLAVVERPKQLWIDTVGGIASSPASQQRSDQTGNVSVGLAANYSVNGISRISPAYYMGESIQLRRLKKPLNINAIGQDSVFQSAFQTMPSSQQYYAGWHTSGSTLPYIQNNNAAAFLQLKTIVPSSVFPGFYIPQLQKYQYEAFNLQLNISSNQTIINGLMQIFGGTWSGTAQVYSANGGYLFQGSQTSINIPLIEYEDMNVNNKQRLSANDCLPLIVATPDSFPTPSVRSTGTISYNPTYSPIGT